MFRNNIEYWMNAISGGLSGIIVYLTLAAVMVMGWQQWAAVLTPFVFGLIAAFVIVRARSQA